MNATTYGMDIAKNVFQVHWVDGNTGEICRKKLPRGKVTEFFAVRPAGRIAMEACGGAHHWGRTLGPLGHQIELLPTHQVRPFISGNKDDAGRPGIWLAAQHGDIRRVAVKSSEQQAMLSLHRMRTHWVSVRTATVNALRGLLYEFGVTLPRGRHSGLRQLAQQRAEINDAVPAVMVRLVDDQLLALADIERHVQAMEEEISLMLKSQESARRLRDTPGIGVLGATALAATLGDGTSLRNGREFACPRSCSGSSGHGRQSAHRSISKRGNAYLRTLLINGARALASREHPAPWIVALLGRRPFNVVVVAIAHKLARIAWALVAHGRAYERAGKRQIPRQRVQARCKPVLHDQRRGDAPQCA
ncbi:IS110 family transposase [Zoogloea sp.]|uniref:IS110 family transposase n=1 Tax=Zoogloea sp. TaxID=49181 RepID=UPI001E19DF7F|nr:IS110 family transposase [Zoogloea sp.]MBK6656487.1 IS110 family transposase [Zoogloea sp.]